VDKGYDVHLIDDTPYKYKNLKFHLLRNFTGIKFIDYLLRIIKIRSIIKKVNPDILHSFQITYHGFMGALSGSHPFVLTPWGSDILYDPGKSIFHKAIVNYAIDKADVIHCIDASAPVRLKQVYGNKIKEKKHFTLNEGVDTKIFSPRKRNINKNFQVLCLRVLRESYGALYLIEALNILVNKKNQYNIRLVMLRRGKKKYKIRVYEKIKEYNLDKYVKFHNWVNYKTSEYMKKADIYADPIFRPVQGQGTGKTMLEAMSSGLAVVAPDNPSIELYVKHKINGIIYKGADSESMANAILLLMKNKKLRLKLGKNAREFILNNLDWEKNMKIMEKTYFDIKYKQSI